jgi:phosphoribosyl 1,2-cyclic phosphate phosphodiesterase
MKFTFLGTGTSQGVPVVACKCEVCKKGSTRDKRLRSSILVETGSEVFVVDAGPDFRQQLLREQVTHLDAILITHRHKDHIAGLDDVRSFNWFTGQPMPVFATLRDQERIREEYSYAFSTSAYPGIPRFDLHTLDGSPFSIGKTEIYPLKVLHMKMEVLGFRIGAFAYLTDTNYIPGSVMADLLNCKVIVLSALRKEKHVSHYNLEGAVKVLEFLRPEKAYLTHMSHLIGFHDEVQQELPDWIQLAYDGLKVEV